LKSDKRLSVSGLPGGSPDPFCRFSRRSNAAGSVQAQGFMKFRQFFGGFLVKFAVFPSDCPLIFPAVCNKM
jgi:hypothetical protein